MNYYFITGTSRGIGRSLAELLLEDANNYVIGISRTCSISHSNYEHISLDLNDLNAVKNFRFIPIIDAQRIVLVNNSGRLGALKHVGALDNDDLIANFTVNTIAPAIMINNFLAAYAYQEQEKIVFTVSSGAGRHPIESWATYCASKSAVDHFSRVADVEQKAAKNNVHFYSVAPGIVDTDMQVEIRATDAADFTDVGKFVAYKQKNQLLSADHVAKKFKMILDQPGDFPNVILDIREL